MKKNFKFKCPYNFEDPQDCLEVEKSGKGECTQEMKKNCVMSRQHYKIDDLIEFLEEKSAISKHYEFFREKCVML